MSSTEILPLGNYPVGTYGPFGPVEIADDVTSVLFSLDRCTSLHPDYWPLLTTTVAVNPEISLDGAQTWIGAGPFGGQGGIKINARTGQETQFTQGGGSIPPAQNGIPRQYRVASAVIAGGILRTCATIEVT